MAKKERKISPAGATFDDSLCTTDREFLRRLRKIMAHAEARSTRGQNEIKVFVSANSAPLREIFLGCGFAALCYMASAVEELPGPLLDDGETPDGGG